MIVYGSGESLFCTYHSYGKASPSKELIWVEPECNQKRVFRKFEQPEAVCLTVTQNLISLIHGSDFPELESGVMVQL